MNGKSRNNLSDIIYTNDVENFSEILFSHFLNNPNSVSVMESLILCRIDRGVKYKKMIEILVHFFETSVKRSNVETLLKIALIKGDLQRAESLLKNGTSLEGSEWKDYSPACFAFCNINNRKIMLELLIKYGLNVNFKNKNGLNILHHFITYSSDKNDEDAVEIAKILIDSGISVNERDKFSSLSYTFSIIKENINLLSFLIDKGADINAQEITGWTALHHAVHGTDHRIISLLIRRGADVRIRDICGFTPFSSLISNNRRHDSCVLTMVKEITRLTFENFSVPQNDLKLIQENLKAREHFDKCNTELKKLASNKFYGSFSYHSILKMSKRMKKLSHLTKNKEFLKRFEENLHKFSCYVFDLKIILEEAIKIRKVSDIIEKRLKDTFGKLLPSVVIIKLASNFTLEDLPAQ